MSENNEGGLADRSAGRTGGISGAGQTGSNSNQGGQNFGSQYGGPPRSDKAAGTPYGITPFNVPRRDQTLQDRQFGTLGGGMVGTNFGGSSGSGANVNKPARAAVAPPPKVVWNPVTRKYVPVPQPKPTRGLPQFTPEDLAQDYYTHIPGTPLPDIPGWDPTQEAWSRVYTAQPNMALVQNPGRIGNTYSEKDQSRIGGSTSFGGIGPGTGLPRKFGGDVSSLPDRPRRYTVGENGPEDLVMTAGSGYVIPNPKDRNHPQAKRMANRIFGAGRPPPHVYGGYPGGVRT